MNKQVSGIVIRLFGTVLVIGVAAWLVLNRQAVVDFVRLQTYQPTTEVKTLADHDQLQPRGRDLFYVSDPQIQDSTAFNQSCSTNEKTIVLGCYKAQQIYLFNVTDPRFGGVKEVTAAHEMLHAAYDRMSDAEKQRINNMLKPIIDGMKDQRILDLIKLYNQSEPGELYNEMHSILGTEYNNLSPELEDYYKQYFQSRAVVVAYANQYQAVFTESEAKIASYDQQLNSLKPQIDQNNATLKAMQADIQAQANQLNQLRTQSRVQEYNQLVPVYNTKVAQFNALIDRTRTLVNQYNQLVEVRNAQVTAQSNLYDGLNSNYQPAAASQ